MLSVERIYRCGRVACFIGKFYDHAEFRSRTVAVLASKGRVGKR
jgi:hypothetical protein